MVRINLHNVLLCALLGNSLWLAPALAEKKSQPIYIVSDSLRVDEKKGLSHFRGHVRFTQGDMVIQADSIRTKTKNGSIDKVIVKGSPVRMNQASTGKEAISATANKVEYFADTEMVHLYGNARLQQGAQQFTGEHIQYNSRSQQVIANGGPQTTKSNGQGRVKAVIMPKTKNHQPDEKQ